MNDTVITFITITSKHKIYLDNTISPVNPTSGVTYRCIFIDLISILRKASTKIISIKLPVLTIILATL